MLKRLPLPLALALLLVAIVTLPRLQAQDRPAGASPSDEAIRRALEYLKDGPEARRRVGAGGFGRATSVTSLAVMAFLAAGHVPGEPGPVPRDGREGHPLRPRPPAVQRHARLEHQPRADVLPRDQHLDARRGRRHDHRPDARRAGAATALAQGGQADPRWPRTCAKNPEHAGGWRYQPTSRDSDISVTGWQVMALRAAKSAGLRGARPRTSTAPSTT